MLSPHLLFVHGPKESFIPSIGKVTTRSIRHMINNSRFELMTTRMTNIASKFNTELNHTDMYKIGSTQQDEQVMRIHISM